jgi:hypothetical protein
MSSSSLSVLFTGTDTSYIAFPVTVTNPNIDLTKVRLQIKNGNLEAYWRTKDYDTAGYFDPFNKVVKINNTYTLVARVTYESGVVLDSKHGNSTDLSITQIAPAVVEPDVYIGGETSKPQIDIFIYS